MNRSLLTPLLTAALFSISATSMASDLPQEQPISLTATQMDEVTAGASFALPGFLQLNVAPVVVTQIRVLNFEMNVNWTNFIGQVIR
ncbi:hypothetical protein Q8A64_02485 [Oxalobacteraceae bacterium R-40]|uniref:Uncharacterized protein n=1 Tax=Keguizhuia sedimenti TaxID=3064264 RepID=A0ABU1BJT7_9BURK|nr:hypothetical protein [Oxalobacteraceae bacterium R-40]